MKLIISLVLALTACVLSNPLEEAVPFFDATQDTRLLIFTRSNPTVPVQVFHNDLNSILNSPFDRTKPLRILTHGWFGDDTTDLVDGAREVLLAHHDFNILVIDWGEGAQTINYIAAVQRVTPVGAFVATFLDFLQSNGLIEYNRVKIIGFSLGASCDVGFAIYSRYESEPFSTIPSVSFVAHLRNGRIEAILGLDPAGPLFSVNNPAGRLDAGDANYVEALHTNGPTLLVAGAGIGAPIAHADFFANGGRSQPGCILNACSHSRAVEFYLEAVVRNGFHAQRCANADAAGEGNCSGTPEVWISAEPTNSQLAPRGIFWFSTNSVAPFSQGQVRP